MNRGKSYFNVILNYLCFQSFLLPNCYSPPSTVKKLLKGNQGVFPKKRAIKAEEMLLLFSEQRIFPSKHQKWGGCWQ